MTAKLRRATLAVVAVVVLGSGCKQGIGDHCEVPDDCASGQCSATQMICESPSTIVQDGATLSRDARFIADADLRPDGAIPTAPDAPPVPDAPIVLDAPADAGP